MCSAYQCHPCNPRFETHSFPKSFAATLAALPSMSLLPVAPFSASTLQRFNAVKARGAHGALRASTPAKPFVSIRG
jgi:hypothetical protein